MSALLFANNATSYLAGPISSTSLTANLAAGTGILFPQPGPGQYFVGTFTDVATGLLTEIVHVTNVAGSTITMVRGQEGTTPQPWNANDIFAELWTAGQAGAMLQLGDAQSQSENFALDTGVINAYSCALVPPITAPVEGMPIRVLIKAGNTNTGPATLNPGSGAGQVTNLQGLPLNGGEIPGGGIVTFIWDGSKYQIPSTIVQAVPPGTVVPFAGNFAPPGYFLCNGQAISRTIFNNLFTAIGVSYGPGDGVATFNVPDLQGRVVAMTAGSSGRLTTATINTPNTVGGVGGQETESAGVNVSVTVGVSGNTGGSLSVTVSGETNNDVTNETAVTGGSGNAAANFHAHSATLNGATSGSLAVSASGSGSGGGSTSAVSNVQPTMIMSYIIKT
jgi:microcystin-dependent protein